VTQVVPGFSSINARITATVTGGNGSVLLAGAQLANVSQDSSGFEMTFRDDLLGGGTAGVSSLNGLIGALTLAAGSNVTITPSGNTLTIAATGGGGLTSVSHDATLAGTGIPGSPLGVAVPLTLQSTDSGAMTIATTANSGEPAALSIVLSGATGGEATGLSITVADTLTGNDATAINASVGGDVIGILVSSQNGPAIVGEGAHGAGIVGSSTSSDTSSPGVRGHTASSSNDASGVLGSDGTGFATLHGQPSAGVRGESHASIGVFGISDSANGMTGLSKTGFAIAGVSETNSAIRGKTFSTDNDRAGIVGSDGGSFTALTGLPSAGVRGESSGNIGVLGVSVNFAVVGRLDGGAQGELASHRNNHDWGLFTLNDISAANGIFTGAISATNLKSFVEPHPSDPTKEIRFVCLEGPESGTYFRGTARIISGFAKIEVPEAFRAVSDETGMTVVMSPVGAPAVLFVAKESLSEIVIQGSADVTFHYMVNGIRKAYRDFAAVQDNRDFIPDGPDDRRFALYAPEIQRRLVATGIYNADGTVNLETARRLGWDRTWGH
jgi:hypothetical protein